MNRKTCFVLLALALPLLLACFLTTCGSSSEQEENCAESYNDLRTNLARICTDKRIYDFAAPIYITFTVTNISNEPLSFDGGDRPALDICVQGECWSDAQELAPELTVVTLEPGESRVLEWVWPTPYTDLAALESKIPPDASAGATLVSGKVILFPGTAPGAVWVQVAYHRP